MSGNGRLAVAVDVLPLVGPPSGIGVFCDRLIGSLATRSELTLSAFAVGRGAARARDRLPRGVPCRAIPVPTRVVHAAWRLTRLPSAEIVAGRVSVVHGTSFVVPPARRAAMVVTVHDMSPWRYPESCPPASRAYPALVHRAIRHGAYVHTPSQFVADEVIDILGADPTRVRAIPHGLGQSDSRDLRQAQAGAGSPRSATARSADHGTGGDLPNPAASFPYVLAIGTIEPRKDYPTLVAAFDHVAADHPDIRLVIAGSEGGATRALDAAVTAARCRERIMRLGYVDETTRTAMLAGASALAYPSIYEGFGLPPLEAMAAGVPVVATDGGAIPEVVGDGAVVVPVGDEVALATALNRILDDDGFRHALVTRGLARASSYSWQATGGAMAALYDDAAADRRSRTSWRS